MLTETGPIAVRGKQITLCPRNKVKLPEQRGRWCCWAYLGQCGRGGASGDMRGLDCNLILSIKLSGYLETAFYEAAKTSFQHPE